MKGNIVPISWYHEIVKPTGKPDMNAIAVLAELVFWHRPVYENGKYRSKFKGEKFKINYKKMSQILNLTEKDIQRALAALEKLNLIKRVIVRDPKANGVFVEPNFERIEVINNFVDNSVDNSVDNFFPTGQN